MFFTEAEKIVIRKAVADAPAKVYPRILEILVKKVSEILKKYPQMSFVEARRNALNECHVKDKKVRQAYNSALGAYFGRRGGLKASKRDRSKPKRIKEKGDVPSKHGAGGQIELMI